MNEALSADDNSRIATSAIQLSAYINLARWLTNFPRDELRHHPQYGGKAFLFSGVQSSRFCFAVEHDTLWLGVQRFECAWMAPMPFTSAVISDRLYLKVNPVACMGGNITALSLGILVDEQAKLNEMRSAQYVQLVQVEIANGSVTRIGRDLGVRFPITKSLVSSIETERDQMRERDTGRFF